MRWQVFWIGFLCVPISIAAYADEMFYVSQRFAGNILRLHDLNGDGDALDPGEQTVWGTGFTGVSGLEAVGPAVYAVEQGLAAGFNQIVRLEDRNGDGDALDVGERLVWANGLDDPRDAAHDGGGNWYVSEFSNNQLWRLVDQNQDGDALDVGERMLYAEGIDGPASVLSRPGELIVAANRGNRIHRLSDRNGDGDALDAAENVVITPNFDQVLGLLDDGEGGFFFSSFSDDTVYHAADINNDGDMLDIAEVLNYADPVFGGMDGPWNMVALGSDGAFLLTDHNHNRVLLVHDRNGDGDALDLGEVVSYATGIAAPLDVVAEVVAPSFLEADFDRDGDVDGDDFLLWQTGFGTTSGAEKMDGDYDNDGDVDGDDFLGWQAEFGSGSGSVSGTVPEPTAALLMMIIVSAVACFERRRRAKRVSELVCV